MEGGIVSTTSESLAPTPFFVAADGADAYLALDARHDPRRRWTTVAVWSLRALILVPFVLMTPELVAAATHQPNAVANLSTSTADVLGTSTFLAFVLMLTVTPVQIVTGWHWHVTLRRDFGIGMFLIAAVDLVLAALTTDDTFHGGFFDRIGGHTFLFVGTLSTLLLVPLALTANTAPNGGSDATGNACTASRMRCGV